MQISEYFRLLGHPLSDEGPILCKHTLCLAVQVWCIILTKLESPRIGRNFCTTSQCVSYVVFLQTLETCSDQERSDEKVTPRYLW